jgi:prepilin-type N-terminal cleavage/methylation domain-containing protein
MTSRRGPGGSRSPTARVGELLRRRAGDRRGFTLIEMLVVMSILGLLSMVVSLSMIGVTNLAQNRADDEELMTVQSAMNFMMMDQGIQPEDACRDAPSAATRDMTQFPSSRAWAGQSGRQPVRLYAHYVRTQFTRRAYVCGHGGTVEPSG